MPETHMPAWEAQYYTSRSLTLRWTPDVNVTKDRCVFDPRLRLLVGPCRGTPVLAGRGTGLDLSLGTNPALAGRCLLSQRVVVVVVVTARCGARLRVVVVVLLLLQTCGFSEQPCNLVLPVFGRMRIRLLFPF